LICREFGLRGFLLQHPWFTFERNISSPGFQSQNFAEIEGFSKGIFVNKSWDFGWLRADAISNAKRWLEQTLGKMKSEIVFEVACPYLCG